MILGIDLGQKTTGLAISQGMLATPYKTIKHTSSKQILTSVIGIIEKENITTVVIGFVEGKIKKFFEDFAAQLRSAKPNLDVILWDETLTSRQARQSMIKLNVAKKKRGQKEHEVASALILQSYLDSK